MGLAKSANSESFKGVQKNYLSFLNSWGLGSFKSIYEAHDTSHASPLLPTHFGTEELVVAFDCIQYESEHMIFMTELTLDAIQSCLTLSECHNA